MKRSWLLRTAVVGVLSFVVATPFAACDGAWESRLLQAIEALEEQVGGLDDQGARATDALLDRVRPLDTRVAALERKAGIEPGHETYPSSSEGDAVLLSMSTAVVSLQGRVKAISSPGASTTSTPGRTKGEPKGRVYPVPTWAKVADEQIAAARAQGVPVAFKIAYGMRFVLIPPGRFWMGSPPSEKGHIERVEALHEVELTKAYYIQTTEVTNGEYRRFRRGHVSETAGTPRTPLNGETQPVVCVSLADAKAVAAWLSKRDRKRTYRLPTEAEWERACRAGTRTPFWSGSTQADLDRVAWTDRNSGGHTHQVAQKSASPWGLQRIPARDGEWRGLPLRRHSPHCDGARRVGTRTVVRLRTGECMVAESYALAAAERR